MTFSVLHHDPAALRAPPHAHVARFAAPPLLRQPPPTRHACGHHGVDLVRLDSGEDDDLVVPPSVTWAACATGTRSKTGSQPGISRATTAAISSSHVTLALPLARPGADPGGSLGRV